MAVSDAHESVTKQRLENTVMNLYRVRARDVRTISTFELTIPDFRKMKDNVHYNKTVVEMQCDIDLYKKRNAIGISFYTMDEHVSSVLCYINYGQNSRSDASEGIKRSKYDYEIYLRQKMIFDSRNEWLKNGYLVLQIVINSENSYRVMHPYSGARPYSNDLISAKRALPWKLSKRAYEMDRLASDLTKLFTEKRIHRDFTIRFKNKSLPVNKALFALRSEFFHRYICEDHQEIILDVQPRIIILVICFLYSGSLVVPQGEDVLEILKLAVTLRINSLIDAIVVSLRNRINKDNVDLIRKTASETGLEKLLEIANNYDLGD